MIKYIVALILIAVTMALLHAVSKNPHYFSASECASCHADHMRDPRRRIAEITDICTRCHSQITMMSSHPVDVYPATTTIPPDLPLRNKMVVCITCHNIHAERFSSLGEKTYFLRRPAAGRTFCLACHKEKPVEDSHTSALVAAHIGNRFRVTDANGHLDEISVACITCHDGTVGKSADFRLGGGIWQHSSPDQSHPIGVDYETSRMSMGHLKAKQMIDKRIRFFDGKIGCGTCHDMYLKSRNYLVMSNKGSRLCTSCHEL